MTCAASLGKARDAIELAQQYARLAETQRTVIVPTPNGPEEHATAAVALLHARRAMAAIRKAMGEMEIR